jgi:hypothetical protein
MGQKETHILIATGGYLNDEVKVVRLVFEEDDLDDDVLDDFDNDFGEYVDYRIEEVVAEFEQGFSSTMVIKEEQLPQLIEELNKAKELAEPKKPENEMKAEDFYVGAYVSVAPPEPGDLWIFEFSGIVLNVKEDYCTVEDGEGNCWDVGFNKLTLE